jgi:thiosulfate reductase cytochrome b subunit
MNALTAAASDRHALWVRLCHWAVALSFCVLAITGFLILMVHPRLYWGEAGNDLMPALLELPISANHRPEGWRQTVEFSQRAFSAGTYSTFNENSWARSTHFLAGWMLVLVGAVYVLLAAGTGHWRKLFPRASELTPAALWQDIKDHVRLESAVRIEHPRYGPLQKSVYTGVVFVALPFMVLTGLTMSPGVTAAYPILLDVVGGYQSARTLHFAGFAALLLFLFAHVVMVSLTGFRRQIRAMILGEAR